MAAMYWLIKYWYYVSMAAMYWLIKYWYYVSMAARYDETGLFQSFPSPLLTDRRAQKPQHVHGNAS